MEGSATATPQKSKTMAVSQPGRWIVTALIMGRKINMPSAGLDGLISKHGGGVGVGGSSQRADRTA